MTDRVGSPPPTNSSTNSFRLLGPIPRTRSTQQSDCFLFHKMQHAATTAQQLFPQHAAEIGCLFHKEARSSSCRTLGCVHFTQDSKIPLRFPHQSSSSQARKLKVGQIESPSVCKTLQNFLCNSMLQRLMIAFRVR